MAHHGQITPEFLSMLLLVFLLFGVFVVIFFHQSIVLRQIQEQAHARGLAQKLVVLISSVYVAGDGARVEDTVAWVNYTAAVHSGLIEVSSPHGEVVQYALLTTNVTNVSGLNATFTIHNQGGFVVIE